MQSVIFKKNRLKICLFFFIAFSTHNLFGYELIDIDKQLKTADSLRSSNIKRFDEIILQLANNKDSFSNEQTQYLNYLLAYKQSISGKLESSIKNYKAILKSNASNKIKFRANSSIINTFAITQNWAGGLTHLSNNFKLLDEINDKSIKQNGIIVAVIFYNLLGQYELGLKYIEKIRVNAINPRTVCFANQLFLEAKFNLSQLNNDNVSIDNGIESCVAANEKIMANIIREYQIKLKIENNLTQQAIIQLNKNLDDVKDTKYSPLISRYYTLLAKAYYMEEKYIKAKEYANKTLAKTGGSGNSKPLVSAYLLLYKIHLQDKAYQEALSYYVKYSEAKNAHLEGEKAKYLAFQLAEHKSFAQESQIKLLNEKNNALAAEQALAKTQAANRKLIILLLGLVILAFTFIGIRFHRSHKRVKELAEYDPLTGIYNRGHFTHVTNSALKYCKNAEQDLSVIMFDLDHFKKVNDSFGHACGDWALKETIKVCQRIGRKNDIFARLGGEEFCLVLTSCTIDIAMLRAEACRAAIEEIVTEESGCEFSITASFGVTDLKRSGFTLDKLLADADMAAYASKNAGRNRVTMFKVPQTSQPKKLDNSWNYEK